MPTGSTVTVEAYLDIIGVHLKMTQKNMYANILTQVFLTLYSWKKSANSPLVVLNGIPLTLMVTP